LLDQQYLKAVNVSTVHSVQGAQAPVVIFDPVFGTDRLLTGQDGGRLINVALSRAQSKLILLLSAADLANPLFAQMASIVQRRANRAAKPIADVLVRPKYITRAVGERVYIGTQVGEITRFSRDGADMWAVMESSKEEFFFNTADWRG
jgi:hypothetical protein